MRLNGHFTRKKQKKGEDFTLAQPFLPSNLRSLFKPVPTLNNSRREDSQQRSSPGNRIIFQLQTF